MRWDFLISTQQNLFVIFGAPKELCSNGERKNDGALISIHRNPLAKSLLTIGVLERAKRNWNHLELFGTASGPWYARSDTGTPAGQAAGLLPRGRLLPISIVNTYERSYEGEGLAIGSQNGRVNLASWRQEERDTHQRQSKQGGDDGYHQLHPRAVVSFHRRLSLEQNEHVFFKEQN